MPKSKKHLKRRGKVEKSGRNSNHFVKVKEDDIDFQSKMGFINRGKRWAYKFIKNIK